MTKKSLSTLAAIAFVATLGMGAATAGCGFGVTEPRLLGDTVSSPNDTESPGNTTLGADAHVNLAAAVPDAEVRIG